MPTWGRSSPLPKTALEVNGLTAGYGGEPIVKNFSLVAGCGQITVLVGPNGAGKSTAAKAIAGVLRPTAGQVLVEGSDVAGLRPEQIARKRLAYVPQVLNVFPSLTVRDNLELGAYLCPRRSRHEKIDKMLDLFPDLRDAVHRPARTLSGGQRHMLGIARGLMADPVVLVLDEPTAGLSPRYEARTWEHIRAIRSMGIAVVVIDQNTRQALSQADWAYVMVLGEKHLEGTGAAVLENETVTELYIGRSD